MKIRKKRMGIIILVGIIALGVVLYLTQNRDLALNGDAEVVINIGEVYEEAGVNIKGAAVTGSVDTEKAGDYTLTYQHKDQKVTRIVHVVDPNQLTVGLKGTETTLVRQGDPYIESGAFAIDAKKGVVTDWETEGEVDTEKPGKYEVKYKVESGYVKKEITRYVEVVDKEKFKENDTGVPVLMYHYVYTADDIPDSLNTNYILDEDFEEQLAYLKAENYYFPSFEELRAYVDGKIALPEKSVILTFDDGQKGFLEYGIPLLNEYEIPATSFLIGSHSGEKKIKTYASPYVSFESHSFDMHKAGGHIGHGGIISALSKEEIEEDLRMQQKMVGSKQAFAYPYGDVTEDAKAAVADADIRCAFTTEFGKVYPGDDYRVLSRVRVIGDSGIAAYKAQL